MDTSGSSSSCSRALNAEASFKNTSSESSWTGGEHCTFENVVAVNHSDSDSWKKFTFSVPGKSTEDAKLRHKALQDSVAEIGSSEVPLRIDGKHGIHLRNEEHGGLNWTEEEEKALHYSLILFHGDPDLWDKVVLAVPGKSIEELKLHHEALVVESRKVPLTHHFSGKKGCRKKKKPLGIHERKRFRWTEEEHRSFLSGLEKFGRGDWKSISSYCVPTKTNTQVASHAQKYFTGLNSARRNQKQSAIKDTSTVHLGSTPSVRTTIMPGNPFTASMTPLSPKPLGITPNSPFSTQLISNPTISAKGKPTDVDPFWQDDEILPPDDSFSFTTGIPPCSSFITPDLLTRPTLDLTSPVKKPTSTLPVPSRQNDAVPPPSSSDAPSTSNVMECDSDIFALPKIVDID